MSRYKKSLYKRGLSKYRKVKRRGKKFVGVLVFILTLLYGCFPNQIQQYAPWLPDLLGTEISFELDDLPEYDGKPYVVINNNIPGFTSEEITTEAYEKYSFQDLLGRCGSASACIGKELMPTEERESISEVIPSGWQSKTYDFVDQEYLYNRCHLIGFQLTGENANEKNLITGTRYMNVDGMLPFENEVAQYIYRTGNHVMYRVTPVFEGANLVASGVQMEAYSVEDRGLGVCFHVFVYNVQPGVEINYLTGESHLLQ